jgi:hypothetical protein
MLSFKSMNDAHPVAGVTAYNAKLNDHVRKEGRKDAIVTYLKVAFARRDLGIPRKLGHSSV